MTEEHRESFKQICVSTVTDVFRTAPQAEGEPIWEEGGVWHAGEEIPTGDLPVSAPVCCNCCGFDNLLRLLSLRSRKLTYKLIPGPRLRRFRRRRNPPRSKKLHWIRFLELVGTLCRLFPS